MSRRLSENNRSVAFNSRTSRALRPLQVSLFSADENTPASDPVVIAQDAEIIGGAYVPSRSEVLANRARLSRPIQENLDPESSSWLNVVDADYYVQSLEEARSVSRYLNNVWYDAIVENSEASLLQRYPVLRERDFTREAAEPASSRRTVEATDLPAFEYEVGRLAGRFARVRARARALDRVYSGRSEFSNVNRSEARAEFARGEREEHTIELEDNLAAYDDAYSVRRVLSPLLSSYPSLPNPHPLRSYPSPPGYASQFPRSRSQSSDSGSSIGSDDIATLEDFEPQVEPEIDFLRYLEEEPGEENAELQLNDFLRDIVRSPSPNEED